GRSAMDNVVPITARRSATRHATWYRSLALPWAAAAALALVAGYETLWVVPSLRRASPLALVPVTLRPASRGAETVVPAVPGGRIVRPHDLMIDTSVASSLTVVGGRSHANAGDTRFGDFISFGAASTSAEGVFDDFKQQIELTHHRVAEGSLTTSTRVNADLAQLSVGN